MITQGNPNYDASGNALVSGVLTQTTISSAGASLGSGSVLPNFPVSTAGLRAMSIQIIANGGAQYQIQVSNDNVTYQSINIHRIDSGNWTFGISLGGSGMGYATLSGFQWVRVITASAATSAYSVQCQLMKEIPGSTLTFNAPIISSTLGATPVTYIINAATPVIQAPKASAGNLTHLSASNSGSMGVWLKVYNAAATLGSTSAILNYFVPANSTINPDLGFAGLKFTTAINAALTGGSALADNTSLNTFTFTATTSNNSNQLTNCTGFTNFGGMPYITTGLTITGTGIPASTTITGFNAQTGAITMSANATANGTGITISASGGIYSATINVAYA